MANPSGKKAELDKDGIAYDIGKAELDKEGVSLSDEQKTETPAQPDTLNENPETAAPARFTRRRMILIGSIASGVIVLLLVAGIVTYQVTKEEPKPQAPVAAVKTTPPPGLDSAGGDIPLDPFMVLYNPGSSKESGVLLAQVGLQASPEIAYNIGARMHEIRSLVYRRLAANAEVFSKNELASMIREDLKAFNVRDVAFIQFEKK